jgi:hypothetical protein
MVRLTAEEQRTLARREVFCRECFLLGVRLANAVAYADIVCAQGSNDGLV